MKRAVWNQVIDLLAAISLLAMIGTGYILRFPLPPATNRTHELWGLSRHEWGTIHAWASLCLLAVLLVHVVLHWEWIYGVVRRRITDAKAGAQARFRAGVVTLLLFVAVVGLFAWATHRGVRELETPRHPLGPAVLQEDAAAPPTPAAADIRAALEVFEAFCIHCHGPDVQRARFRVDRRDHFFPPEDATGLVVPGAPEESRLMRIVTGREEGLRFPAEHRLPPDDAAVVRAWIAAGAAWPDGIP